MKKQIGNYGITLTGNMISIYYNGNLIKAYQVSSLWAVEKFNQTATKLKTLNK
jgi:TfoX/Sxy family transcriptional regulator of competence genes